MKASELRIGNWVIDHEAEPETTIYWQVESVEPATYSDNMGVRFRNRSCWTAVEYVEPIPLTEEWLVKFGFDSESYKRGYTGKHVGVTDFVLSEPNEMGFKHNYAFTYDGFKFTELKYVHQLQNLYQALTGQELEIKE